jgi:hypothetical protein
MITIPSFIPGRTSIYDPDDMATDVTMYLQDVLKYDVD